MNVFQELREFFVQKSAVERVRARSPEVHAFITERLKQARAYADIADAHTDAESAVATCTLYREALLHLAAAYASDRSGEVPAGSIRSTGRAALKDYLEAGAKPDAIDLGNEDWPETPEPQLAQESQHLGDLFAELLAQMEPRSLGIIRVTRALRLSAVALGALYILYLLGARLWRGENLALRAQASASSQLEGTIDARGVINGKVENTFGVHTQKEADPWVRLDFGAERTIKQVIVYPRGDGYANESLPLILESSSDGQVFSAIATRRDPFTQQTPWVVKSSISARYLRIHRNSFGYISLSEIEAYAR